MGHSTQHTQSVLEVESLFMTVLSHLSVNELLTAELVSNSWKDAIRGSHLWKHLKWSDVQYKPDPAQSFLNLIQVHSVYNVETLSVPSVPLDDSWEVWRDTLSRCRRLHTVVLHKGALQGMPALQRILSLKEKSPSHSHSSPSLQQYHIDQNRRSEEEELANPTLDRDPNQNRNVSANTNERDENESRSLLRNRYRNQARNESERYESENQGCLAEEDGRMHGAESSSLLFSSSSLSSSSSFRVECNFESSSLDDIAQVAALSQHCDDIGGGGGGDDETSAAAVVVRELCLGIESEPNARFLDLVKWIPSFPTLSTLHLQGPCSLKAADVDSLTNILHSQSRIEHLILDCTYMLVNEYTFLMTAVGSNTSLRRLSLRGRMNDADFHIEQLCGVASTNPGLRALELGLVYSRSTTSLLGDMLASNTSLTRLSLGQHGHWHYRHHLDIQPLAAALEVNCHLRELELAGKYVLHEEGVLALAQALRRNTILTLLKMNNGGSTSEFSTSCNLALLEALVRVPSLGRSFAPLSTLHIPLFWNQEDPRYWYDLEYAVRNIEISQWESFGGLPLGPLRRNEMAVLRLPMREEEEGCSSKPELLGTEAVLMLARVLPTNTSLTTLDLKGVWFRRNESIAILCAVLEHNLSQMAQGNNGRHLIRQINMRIEINNRIMSLGVVYHLRELARWPFIHHYNGIDLHAVRNNTVTQISGYDVRPDMVCKDSAIMLAEVLTHNTSLTKINLTDQDLGEQGVVALLGALKADPVTGRSTAPVHTLDFRYIVGGQRHTRFIWQEKISIHLVNAVERLGHSQWERFNGLPLGPLRRGELQTLKLSDHYGWFDFEVDTVLMLGKFLRLKDLKLESLDCSNINLTESEFLVLLRSLARDEEEEDDEENADDADDDEEENAEEVDDDEDNVEEVEDDEELKDEEDKDDEEDTDENNNDEGVKDDEDKNEDPVPKKKGHHHHRHHHRLHSTTGKKRRSPKRKGGRCAVPRLDFRKTFQLFMEKTVSPDIVEAVAALGTTDLIQYNGLPIQALREGSLLYLDLSVTDSAYYGGLYSRFPGCDGFLVLAHHLVGNTSLTYLSLEGQPMKETTLETLLRSLTPQDRLDPRGCGCQIANLDLRVKLDPPFTTLRGKVLRDLMSGLMGFNSSNDNSSSNRMIESCSNTSRAGENHLSGIQEYNGLPLGGIRKGQVSSLSVCGEKEGMMSSYELPSMALDAAYALGLTLRTCTSLTSLTLNCHPFGSEGVIAILSAFVAGKNGRSLCPIHTIDLRRNGCCEVCPALEEAVAALGTTQWEMYNGIPLKSIQRGEISSLIFSSLRPLASETSGCGADGLLVLCRFLSLPGFNLNHLDMSGEGLTTSGALALSAALPFNSSLTSLNLNDNPNIGPEGIQALHDSVKPKEGGNRHNSSVVEYRLSGSFCKTPLFYELRKQKQRQASYEESF